MPLTYFINESGSIVHCIEPVYVDEPLPTYFSLHCPPMIPDVAWNDQPLSPDLSIDVCDCKLAVLECGAAVYVVPGWAETRFHDIQRR